MKEHSWVKDGNEDHKADIEAIQDDIDNTRFYYNGDRVITPDGPGICETSYVGRNVRIEVKLDSASTNDEIRIQSYLPAQLQRENITNNESKEKIEVQIQ